MLILDLFVASLMANLKMLLITAVGTVLALDRFSILVPEATKHMNIVSFYAFNPALIASNLAKSITYKNVAMLWFMPFNILISFIVGSILGWIILKIVKVPNTLRGVILGSSAAGNIGTMFLVIIPSICTEKSSPFGDVEVCNEQALAFSALSMAIGGIYLWLYVYNMVRITASKIANEKDPSESPPNISSEASNGELPPSDDPVDQMEAGNQTAEPRSSELKQQEQTLVQKMIFHINDIAVKYLNLKALFAPSTIAAIVGLVIGIVPPFRNLLIGQSAPLRVLQDSAVLLGSASVPTITLIVGANLLKGLRKSDLKLSALSLIVAVRYIFLPIVGVAIVKGAMRLGLVPSDRPLYQFILLLQYSVPPAINISTITALFGLGEKECSVIFLATYASAPFFLTLWSTFFLWLVKI